MFARSDRGSLPLALMVTILVTGLVSVVTASVVMGQQQTRFDESYERALQVAEHGSDALLHKVQNQEADDVAPGATVTSDGSLEGGGAYEAELVEEDGSLVVRSEGTVGDVTRTVVVGLDGDPTSSAGLVGRDGVTLRGINEVRSFRSGRFVDDDFVPSEDLVRAEDGLPFTGSGIVATNGLLNLKGNTTGNTDGAEIWNTGDGGSCDGTHCDDLDYSTYSEELVVDPDPVEMPGDMDDDDAPTCDEEQGSFEGGETTFEAGSTYCYDGDVTFEGSEEFEGTPDDPVTIYLDGTLTVEGQGSNAASVNFADDAPRPSPSLRIYSAGDEIVLENHAEISAAIHAPRAVVNESGASSAQFDVYGSLVVQEIATQGGWSLFYDEMLDQVDDDDVLSPRTWREE